MLKRTAQLFFFALLLLMPVMPVSAAPYLWSVYDAGSGLSKWNLKSLSQDPGGYLWLGSADADNGSLGGVTVFAGTREIVSYDTGDGLSSRAVNAIAFENIPEQDIDNTELGAAWIATQRGITVLDRKGRFTRILPGNSPLPGKRVRDIIIDRENTKWVSVWENGVTCIDAEYNWAKYVRTRKGLCSNSILAITESRSGDIWFGSLDNGACRFDRDGNWQRFSSINSGLIGNCVRAIEIEPSDRVWFVTTDGISVYDGRNWMSYSSRNSPLGGFTPVTMVIDREANKWIATENGGVFRLDSFGMWTRFHTGNSSLIDNRINDLMLDRSGTVWIATPSGLCSVGQPGRAVDAGRTVSAGNQNALVVSGSGTYAPFESALLWEKQGNARKQPDLSFLLPVFPSGGKYWLCGAFWAGTGFDFTDFAYEISGSRRGVFAMTLNGFFTTAGFWVSGGVISLDAGVALDKQRQYPFPETYPDALKPFLVPGRFIPSDDPEIQALLRRIIRESSGDDMYRTVKDVIYSKFVQNLKSDNETAVYPGRAAAGEPSCVKGVYDVLEAGSGSRHAKSRLICTLFRAANVPSRMVMSLGGQVWAEAWISGAGWIPVEVSYPVFDYLRYRRTSVPKVFAAEEQAVASVSGTDDTLSRVVWSSELDAICRKPVVSDFLKNRRLSQAKILFLKIVSDGNVPENAMLHMDENVYVSAVQQVGETFLVFKDENLKETDKVTLRFNGMSQVAQAGDRFFWKFVPRRIGDILVIENLECSASTRVRGEPVGFSGKFSD